MKVLFRVDGSKKIGIGHLTRSVDIGRKLKEKDVMVEFLSMGHAEAINYLEKHGFKPTIIPICDTPSEETDAVDEKLHDNHYDFIIADLLVRDRTINIKVLKKYCGKLVYITDDTHPKKIRRVNANIVFALSPNIHEDDFTEQVDNTKYYVGLRYFPLKEEFGENKVSIKEEPKNILITLGGSDASNNTIRVLKAIDSMDISSKRITVVVSSASDMWGQLTSTVYKNKVVIKRDVVDMISLMLETDIAICSAGNTLLELLSLGIPTITLPHTKREQEHALEYSKLKGVMRTSSYGPKIDINEVEELFSRLLNDRRLRLDLNYNSQKIIDGKGLGRMVGILNNAGNE